MTADTDIEAQSSDTSQVAEYSRSLTNGRHHSEPRLFADPRIRFTELGLELPDELDIHEWLGIGPTLKLIESGVCWAIGDYLKYGEHKFGEMYSQALDDFGLEYSTLTTYKWVASIYPRESRNSALSFSHHRAAAALQEPQDRADLLKEAENEKWGKERTRHEAKRRKADQDPYNFVLPHPDSAPQRSGFNLFADYEAKRKVRDTWDTDARAIWYACLLDLWYERAGSGDLGQADYLLIYEPGDFVLAFQTARKELGK